MAKTNKPVDLDISGFMQQMQTNKPIEKKENQVIQDIVPDVKTETISHPVVKDTTETEGETSVLTSEPVKRKKGRPPKKNISNQRLIFKTDRETFVRLGSVKFEEKFDLQDIIHLAVIRFLDDNFKKDGSAISEEVRQKIKDDLSKYEIPAEGSKK